MSHKVFTQVLQAIGTPGLSGIDKLLSHYLAVEIDKVAKHIDQMTKNKILSTVLNECELVIKSPDYYKSMSKIEFKIKKFYF